MSCLNEDVYVVANFTDWLLASCLTVCPSVCPYNSVRLLVSATNFCSNSLDICSSMSCRIVLQMLLANTHVCLFSSLGLSLPPFLYVDILCNWFWSFNLLLLVVYPVVCWREWGVSGCEICIMKYGKIALSLFQRASCTVSSYRKQK